LPPPAVGWVVSAADKALFDQTFKKADQDLDGFVNGLEIKDIFLQSGLPQNVLAHIWSLADGDEAGKLNQEQFAVAMWLVKRALAGIEPPPTLAPDMVPPSMRKAVLFEGFDDANKAIDRTAEEVDVIIRDKNQLERDCAQQDADVKIKQGELVCLRADLDATLNTVQQLEKQKGEAQKRLDDLDSQIVRLTRDLEETIQRVVTEQQRRSEEDRLNQSRMELNDVREEEKRIQVKLATWHERARSIGTDETTLTTDVENFQRMQESLRRKNQELSHSVIHFTNIAEGEVPLPETLPDLVVVLPEDRQKISSHTVDSSRFDRIPSFTSSKPSDPFDSSSVDPFKDDPFAAGFNQDVLDPFKESGDPFGSGFDELESRDEGNQGSNQFSNFDPFLNVGGATDDPFASVASVPDLPPKMSKSGPPRPAQPPARPTSAAAGHSPRPSPIPTVAPGTLTPSRASPAPPSPLPKLNPTRPAPSRPAKPPSTTTLFPAVTQDPFSSTEGGDAFPAQMVGRSDPFSCLHMPPPKSDSVGSLTTSNQGTGANTPASFADDTFGGDPFGTSTAATTASSKDFDPFGFDSEPTMPQGPVTNGTTSQGNNIFGLDAFSSSSVDPPNPSVDFSSAFDDPFSSKLPPTTTNGFGDAFDAKFDAFGASSFDFGTSTAPSGQVGGATSGFGAFDADFGTAKAETKPTAVASTSSAVARPTPLSNGAASTLTTKTSSSSIFSGLLNRPPSAKLNPSPKADALHGRERKKSESFSKSKNGIGGKKTDKGKSAAGSGSGTSGGPVVEDAQLEWARRESVRAEEDRRRKMAEQEAADLEFALALSRAEAQSKA